MPAADPSSPASSATRWLDDREQHAWRSVIRGTLNLLTRLDRDLKPLCLNNDDYALLVALSEAPDQQLRMADLATRTAQSRSRLSHHVGRMEARGLVRRESCAEDRRGQFAVLTDDGRALLERAAPVHVTGVREHFLDHLTEAELETLGNVFGRLAPLEADDA